MADGPGAAAPDADLSRARSIGVGCFTAFIGFWSGGMIGVLMGKVAGAIRKCPAPEGLPACDWHWFAAAGMILGATTLPVLALRRLRRRDAASQT
jgi:hypothetical protein